MHLDLEPVSTCGGCGERSGLDIAGVAGSVARVAHDGQVREVVQHGDGVHVKGVARAGLEGPDAALAEDDVGVAFAHDVLGSHQQLVDGARQAALEKHGCRGLPDLLEEVEVLCVAGADLHDVNLAVDEDLHVAGVHDLGHDRHVKFC